MVIFQYRYALKFGIFSYRHPTRRSTQQINLKISFFSNGASNMFIVVYINSLLHKIMGIMISEHME